MTISAAKVATIARAEANKMRAAIAGAAPDAKVDMSVRQFAKLSDLITYLCDLVPDPATEASGDSRFNRNKETAVDQDQAALGARTLAQIEGDMVTAEAAYADADARLKQAERDRRAALDAVNSRQSEIDDAIIRLRRRSPEDSNWRRKDRGSQDVLMLGHEAASEAETALIRVESGASTDDQS